MPARFLSSQWNKVLSRLVVACASIGGDTFSAARWEGEGEGGGGLHRRRTYRDPHSWLQRGFFFSTMPTVSRGRVQLLPLRGVWMCVKIHESGVLAWPRGTIARIRITGIKWKASWRESWVRLIFFYLYYWKNEISWWQMGFCLPRCVFLRKGWCLFRRKSSIYLKVLAITRMGILQPGSNGRKHMPVAYMIT